MKKQVLFLMSFCVCVSYCCYQKVNAAQNLKALSDVTLGGVEAMANGETSGACGSSLLNTTREVLSSGACAIVNEYECAGSSNGSCFVGKIYDYYDSKGNLLGSENKGSTMYCV